MPTKPMILRVFTLLIILSILFMLTTPAHASRGDTFRLSVNDSSVEGDAKSSYPAVSNNGRFIAFESSASNLVTGDTNGKSDIFLNDTLNNTITRVSVSTGGVQGNGESSSAAISADGQYVVFSSYATNLVTGDTNGQSDIFLRDTVANTTTRVSVNSNGVPGNNVSYLPSISADGNRIAFQSAANNLDLVNADTNGSFDIFVYDRTNATTVRVSTNTGATIQADFGSYNPVISGDGQHVAFYSQATTLVSNDTNGVYDVFVHDMTGNTTNIISVDSSVTPVLGDDSSSYPAISSDGHYVAFYSTATNLLGAGNDTNSAADIFVRDTVANTTTRVSVNTAGDQADKTSFAPPTISADGRYVSFASSATNLLGAGNDTNDQDDIFARDTTLGLTTRLSLDTSLAQSDGPSSHPSISGDGNFVAFDSTATNLVDDDTNAVSDIFMHDFTFTADVTPPNVTVNQAAGQSDSTTASPINFTAVFDESIKPSTFIGSDVSFAGSTTVGTLVATISQIAPNDGTTFNIAVSGLSGNGDVIASINASKVTDLVGNGNNVSTSTDNTVTYVDITPPTVSLSSTAGSLINGAITVKAQFSEPVTGFTISDITVGNGVASNFVALSTQSYTFTLTPGTDGTVTADIAASVAQDAANNLNTAATQFSRTYDGTAPTTTINTNPPLLNNNTTPTFTFSGSDGTGSGVALFKCKWDTGSYNTCTSPVTASPALADGTHTFYVYAVDAATNPDASPASYTWTVDTTPPTVISSKFGNINPTDRANVIFIVTFSESVTGVDKTDFSLTTTGVTGAAIQSVTGSGKTYNVIVKTGTGDGTIHLNVLDNNSIIDLLSYPLNGALTTGQTYTVKKTVTFISTSTQDGYVLERSENSSTGGLMDTAQATLILGDDPSRKQYRSFLSFTTSSLPDTAVITSIKLRVQKSGSVGPGDPVKVLKGFIIDIRKGFFGSSVVLSPADFQAAPHKSYGPLIIVPSVGWYNFTLTPAAPYINKLSTLSGVTQIRLRFALDDNNNSLSNQLKLYSGNAGVASRPQLIISYYVP